MPEADQSPHPNRLSNRYRIDAAIGEGAHATTWRGWDERLERPVAIKMLHQHLTGDSVFVQRFQAEAKVAASVRQANVVDVYDFGQENGTLYIIMQFVDGEDLKSLIQRVAPMSIRGTRRIIGNVLDGLQAIHAVGIIHRDIKPQNVLIGTDGIARVTDFGIAEVDVTAGLTGDGLTIGTVDYMAPEQAQGLPLTSSADLYATGVMLYEMLTGTLPFHGENSRQTMLQHINAPLTPPGIRLPQHGISPVIDAVVAQSMAKDPARRFGSARAMKQAVGPALASPRAEARSQATTVLPAQSAPPNHVQSAPYRVPAEPKDAGAGLNSVFKALIALLVIGALGIGIWGAFELMDLDGVNFSLPSFGSQHEQAVPTPTSVPELDQSAPIEPNNPVPEAPVVVPTIEPEPTILPPEKTDTPPIEPMNPGEQVDPEIEPSGYDGEYPFA